MPLDKAKARSDIQGARYAYMRGPSADFIQKLATHAEEALNELDTAQLTTQRAMNDVSRYQRELDDEKTAYRKLREQSANTEACVAVLREISASPKGAQKKAAELLAKIGAVESVAPVAVPAKVVVP
jgi:hypothetical protein